MNLPKTEISLMDTHRLIPSRFSESGTVLSRLTDDLRELQDLIALESGTNDRLRGEEGLLPGISVHELVFGVTYAHIVNGSFTHASPEGGRFNNAARGAWYAGIERETSLAEVAFHKLRQLEEVDWQEEEHSNYIDYLADFVSDFHDLRGTNPNFKQYLRGGPIPSCYQKPQLLASRLMEKGANGVIYPSVRRSVGICIVCFRPALVYHVRKGAQLEFTLRAGRAFDLKDVRAS